MNTQNPWLSFAANALGGMFPGLAGLIGVFLGNRLGASREARLKAIEAAHRRRDRGEDFEEKTLLSFGEKMVEVVQVLSKMKAATLIHARSDPGEQKGKAFADSVESETEFMARHADFYLYLTRIHDEEIRKLGGAFLNRATHCRLVYSGLEGPTPRPAGDVEANAQASRAMVDAFAKAAERIGERGRAKAKAGRSLVDPA